MKYLIVMLGAVGVSLSPIFVRLSDAPSLILVLYRLAFAALILTPYVFLRCRDELSKITWRELLICLLNGLILGLHFASYAEALRHTSITAAAVLVNTEAIFVTLGSAVFLKAVLSGKVWFAVLLTFAGSVVVAMADVSTGGGMALSGNLLALSGAVFGALNTVVGTICRRRGLSTMVYSYLLYTAAALTVLVFDAAMGMSLTGYGPRTLLTTLGMAVCCTIGGHSIYSWGLKFLPASFVSTTKMMEPVFASVWGLILFREIPSILVILGAAVVITGVALYSRASGDSQTDLAAKDHS